MNARTLIFMILFAFVNNAASNDITVKFMKPTFVANNKFVGTFTHMGNEESEYQLVEKNIGEFIFEEPAPEEKQILVVNVRGESIAVEANTPLSVQPKQDELVEGANKRRSVPQDQASVDFLTKCVDKLGCYVGRGARVNKNTGKFPPNVENGKITFKVPHKHTAAWMKNQLRAKLVFDEDVDGRIVWVENVPNRQLDWIQSDYEQISTDNAVDDEKMQQAPSCTVDLLDITTKFLRSFTTEKKEVVISNVDAYGLHDLTGNIKTLDTAMTKFHFTLNQRVDYEYVERITYTADKDKFRADVRLVLDPPSWYYRVGVESEFTVKVCAGFFSRRWLQGTHGEECAEESGRGSVGTEIILLLVLVALFLLALVGGLALCFRRRRSKTYDGQACGDVPKSADVLELAQAYDYNPEVLERMAAGAHLEFKKVPGGLVVAAKSTAAIQDATKQHKWRPV